MKVKKAQALLYMFSMLYENNCFSKIEIMDELEINEQQFKRYMQELRAFLDNFNYQYEIKFIRNTGKYVKCWR